MGSTPCVGIPPFVFLVALSAAQCPGSTTAVADTVAVALIWLGAAWMAVFFGSQRQCRDVHRRPALLPRSESSPWSVTLTLVVLLGLQPHRCCALAAKALLWLPKGVLLILTDCRRGSFWATVRRRARCTTIGISVTLCTEVPFRSRLSFVSLPIISDGQKLSCGRCQSGLRKNGDFFLQIRSRHLPLVCSQMAYSANFPKSHFRNSGFRRTQLASLHVAFQTMTLAQPSVLLAHST